MYASLHILWLGQQTVSYPLAVFYSHVDAKIAVLAGHCTPISHDRSVKTHALACNVMSSAQDHCQIARVVCVAYRIAR